jgi:hypothetical protein
MTKFSKSREIGSSDFLFQIIRFWQFQNKTKEEIELKDLKIQYVLKHEKGHQETKMEENKARSRSRKNRTVRFWIPEYQIFSE